MKLERFTRRSKQVVRDIKEKVAKKGNLLGEPEEVTKRLQEVDEKGQEQPHEKTHTNRREQKKITKVSMK